MLQIQQSLRRHDGSMSQGLKDTAASKYLYDRVKKLNSKDEVEGVLDIFDEIAVQSYQEERLNTALKGITCRRSFRAGIHFSLFDGPDPEMNALFYTENAVFWGSIISANHNNNCRVAREKVWQSKGKDGIYVFKVFQNWADVMGANKITVHTLYNHRNEQMAKFMEKMQYHPEYILYSRDL